MSSTSLRRDFVLVTSELAMLDVETARRVADEAATKKMSPVHLAMSEGLLTGEQVEVVEILLAPADAVPGYEILSLLGYGGMGAVFRARQINLDRIIALKTVLLSRGVGPAALGRFEQEAVALARLVHPNIVSAFDFGKHQGKLYLALEYVEGEDAEKFSRRRGPLDEALTWNLIRQAASGLSHAMSHGIVHRDIKPANLLLVAPPAGYPLAKGVPLVKIADFGLALLASDGDERTRLTTAGTAVGSPNYMAPEQLTGTSVDHRADLYALGATAYHFLSGRAPFSGLPLSAVIGQKLSTGPVPLRQLMPTLDAESTELVGLLMAEKPEDRMANYEILLERLERWTGRVADQDRQNSASAPTMELQLDTTDALKTRGLLGRGRRRWLSVAVGGITVLCVAIGIALQFRPLPPPGRGYRSDAYTIERQFFGGDSLQGWQLEGEWRPGQDEDGAAVIIGRRGTATQRIVADTPQGRITPPFYRMTMLLNRRHADAVHIEFDLPPQGTGLRHEIVVSAEQVAVINGTDGKQTPGRRFTVPLAFDAAENLTLQWVRLPTGWLVLLEEQPLYELPHLHHPPGDRFRLRVIGGPAYFSDLSIALPQDI